MKLKIIQLIFVFLATGLIVSSKETATKSKSNCTIKCVQNKAAAVEKKKTKKNKQNQAYSYALAPGSYIFYY